MLNPDANIRSRIDTAILNWLELCDEPYTGKYRLREQLVAAGLTASFEVREYAEDLVREEFPEVAQARLDHGRVIHCRTRKTIETLIRLGKAQRNERLGQWLVNRLGIEDASSMLYNTTNDSLALQAIWDTYWNGR